MTDHPKLLTPKEKIFAQYKAIAEEHNASLEEMLTSSRRNIVVEARHECYYVAWLRGDMNIVQIGRHFNQHHASVVYGIGRHMVTNGLPDNNSFAKFYRRRKSKYEPTGRKVIPQHATPAEKVRQIKSLLPLMPVKKIVEVTGVSNMTIYAIRRGDKYAHID